MGNPSPKTHTAITGTGSALTKYQDVIVGNRSYGFLLYYELCVWLAIIPGALGMLLRQLFWPRLFGSCGKKVAFAAGIVLRHPKRIHLGNSVVISEGCVLDARNEDQNETITLGDDTILSNNVVLSCKGGVISIGTSVGLNSGTVVQSTNNCPVIIGDDGIIGQNCFIIGGGSYNIDRIDIPIRLQGIKDDGGVSIGSDVWLGANVTVLGGVTIGEGTVVAASAVMTKSVESYSICKGIPAQVTGNRKEDI